MEMENQGPTVLNRLPIELSQVGNSYPESNWIHLSQIVGGFKPKICTHSDVRSGKVFKTIWLIYL